MPVPKQLECRISTTTAFSTKSITLNPMVILLLQATIPFFIFRSTSFFVHCTQKPPTEAPAEDICFRIDKNVRQITNSPKISVRVEHGKIQKPRSRNWKNFGPNKWKGRNNKRIVETGVNSEGNYYTVFSDGSYRYDNYDGYHYKNSNGKSVLFIISKCLKIGFRQHIHSKRHPWSLQGSKWQKWMDQEALLSKGCSHVGEIVCWRKKIWSFTIICMFGELCWRKLIFFREHSLHQNTENCLLTYSLCWLTYFTNIHMNFCSNFSPTYIFTNIQKILHQHILFSSTSLHSPEQI